MKVINLCGASGIGKSTVSAGLFHLMKLNLYNCELVTEFAKQLVWQKRFTTLKNQYYVMGKQLQRLIDLDGQVDYVVTDSPLFLSAIYTPPNFSAYFKQDVIETFKQWDNFNILLNRVKPFNPVGRMETEEQSNSIHVQVEKLLINNEIPYIKLNGDEDAPKRILEVMQNQNLYEINRKN